VSAGAPASQIVITGLDPVINAFLLASEDVDGRIKSGHDGITRESSK
jgi:hypothetical protein